MRSTDVECGSSAAAFLSNRTPLYPVEPQLFYFFKGGAG
jgi:hypothetical protein